MSDATLLTDKQRPAVRLERHLVDPPEVVWKAITDRDQLRSWFPCDVEVSGGRWEVGATITFRFSPEIIDVTLEGRVLAVEEPKLLVYTWGEDTLRFELHPDAHTGTTLVLIDELPPGSAARNAAGWEECLNRLAGRSEERGWQALFERYAAEFAPVLGPQEGPPPGHSVSEQAGVRTDDSHSGRQPTSHERRAGRPWDASYVDGPPPWDIGQPQPAILRLADEGAFTGAVLDAGCGTGENALHVASLGLHVLGVDLAETALSIAREKAAARSIDADFVIADVLRLDRLGQMFETVLDCGLFHTFDSDERGDYVASLASVIDRGGNLHMLCFSDVGPVCGPHPVGQDELRAAFKRSSGWNIASVSPNRIRTRFEVQDVPAWLVEIERI